MDDFIKKSKRKRTNDSETDRPLKAVKYAGVAAEEHSNQGDRSLVPNDSVPIIDDSHTQLLDSIGGYIKELTRVNDSLDASNDESIEPLSKSAARRLKKRNKQTHNVQPISKGQSVEESPCVASKEIGIEYLKMWSEEREKWSFKKKIQFWLLQNMYHKSKVPKTSFKVLLDYLEGLQGHQRQLVVDKAKNILEQYSEDNQTEGSPTKREYKRAVSILRVLA